MSAVLEHRRHGRGARRIHPDLAVPVERHERPGRVHALVDHREVEAVVVADRLPVVHGCPAERVRADADARLADRVDVDDVREVLDVVRAEVVGLDAARLGLVHAAASVGDELVGAVRDPARGVGVGRAAVRRVVLEAAVLRRVVRGRDHDAVGLALRALRGVVVPLQDRVREGRGGHVVVELVGEHAHLVRHEHVERGGLRRRAERVRVGADEERAGDALRRAVLHDGLRDGEDVVLVERGVEGGAAVAGRAERHALLGDRDIRFLLVVGPDEGLHVDQVGFGRRGSRSLVHLPSLPRPCSRRHPLAVRRGSAPRSRRCRSRAPRARPRPCR